MQSRLRVTAANRTVFNTSGTEPCSAKGVPLLYLLQQRFWRLIGILAMRILQ
jgi:hypothetical protein